MLGNSTVTPGTPFVVNDLPAGTSIGVAPGVSGSMLVQYRITDGGPLRNWPSGSVTANTDDILKGPVRQVQFTATTAAGIAEWNASDNAVRRG